MKAWVAGTSPAMTNLSAVLIGVCLTMALPALALAQDKMDWAYPVTPPPQKLDNVSMKSVPGSTKKYTQAQIDDPFNPPDWFPGEHPPMPEIVARGGQKPAGRACAQCHLPSGDGHPESASLAGLNADYIVRQMAAFKNGERKGVRAGVMIAMAKVLTDAEVKAAADYFAALKPTPGYHKAREAEKVPGSYVGPGGMRFVLTDAPYEPVGSRIIVLPDKADRAELRDPKSGFTDFVAKGMIAKGADLAGGGNGKTAACVTCHGQGLKGLAEVPGIVGRPATYIFRQLNDMKTGNRSGAGVELMKPVVARLDQDDMIALSAFLGSQAP
jgi:cytochrome c553